MMEKESVQEETAQEGGYEEETIDLEKEDQTVKTTMLIPRKTLREIGHIGVDEGISKAEVIRKALKEYVENHNPKVKEDKEYENKVKRLLEAKKRLKDKGYSVELEDEDFLEENIDEAITELEKEKEAED